MPRKRSVSWAGRHHDCRIDKQGPGVFSWVARNGAGDMGTDVEGSLSEAKHACMLWVDDMIDWCAA